MTISLPLLALLPSLSSSTASFHLMIVPSLCSPSSGVGIGTATPSSSSSSSQLHQHHNQNQQQQHCSPLSSSSCCSNSSATTTTAHNTTTTTSAMAVPTFATSATGGGSGSAANVSAGGTADHCRSTITDADHHHQPVKKIRRRRPKEDKLLMPRRSSLPQGIMVKSDGTTTTTTTDALGGPCSVGSITVMDEMNGGIVKMEGVVEQHHQQQQQLQFQSPSLLSCSTTTPISNNNTSNESISSSGSGAGGGGCAETCVMPSSARDAQCQQFVMQHQQQQHQMQQQSSPPALLHEQRRQAASMLVEDLNTLMECDDEGGPGDQRQKKCRVCGDSATGYNFNVISCESCKAFFRRNALRPKEFKCPYSNECEITALSRRFCQKCRLRKCFEVGMKKEWILSDEQLKRRKNARIKCQQQQQHPNGGGIAREHQHNNHNNQHQHHQQNHHLAIDQQQLTPTTTPVSSVASSGATGGAVHTPGSVGSAIGGVGGGGGTPNCFDLTTSISQPPLPTATTTAGANSSNSNNNSFSPPQNLFYHNNHNNNVVGMPGSGMAQPQQHSPSLASMLNHNSNSSAGASPLALAALSALMAGASPAGGGQLSTAENSPLGSALAAIGNSPRGGGTASAMGCFDANKVSPCSIGVQSPPPILPIIDPNQQRGFLTQQQQQLLLQTVFSGAAAAAAAAQATTGGGTNASTLANAAIALARGGHTQQAVAALQQLQQQQQQVAAQQQNGNNSNTSSSGLSPLIIDQCHRLMMLGQQQQHQPYNAAATIGKGSPPTASLIKAGPTVVNTVPGSGGGGGTFNHHKQHRQQISPTSAVTVLPSALSSYGSGVAAGDTVSGTEQLPPTTPTGISGGGIAGDHQSSPASVMLAHFQRMDPRQKNEALQRHIQNTVQDELNMSRSPPADSSPSSRSTPTSGGGTMPLPPFIAAAGINDHHYPAKANSAAFGGNDTAGTGAVVPTSSTASSPAQPGATTAATTPTTANAVPSIVFKDLRAFQLNSLELRDVETVKAAFSLMEDELRKSAANNMAGPCKNIAELMLLLETMLRRMVKVVKKLPAFNELSQSGRFALMKDAIIDMLTVRGAVSVDVENECWKRPLISNCEIRLNFNILDQMLNGSMQTRRVTGFYKQLHQTLMKDQMANNLVILIMMFNHHINTDLSAEDKSAAVKHHATYTELLKRYLESIYGPEEARQIYETVPKAFVMLNIVTEKAKELFRARVPTEDEKMLKHIKLAAEIFPTKADENKEKEEKQQNKQQMAAEEGKSNGGEDQTEAAAAKDGGIGTIKVPPKSSEKDQKAVPSAVAAAVVMLKQEQQEEEEMDQQQQQQIQ
ncbi:hypothetical protein niasHT_001326 [Heterodera trifolii]|uniref:Nuclear receptor domain-containing protein n=1 Tax=Heterodera trifolii TaxID=157864 RepID=A0ABD2MCW2_9BILA